MYTKLLTKKLRAIIQRLRVKSIEQAKNTFELSEFIPNQLTCLKKIIESKSISSDLDISSKDKRTLFSLLTGGSNLLFTICKSIENLKYVQFLVKNQKFY